MSDLPGLMTVAQFRARTTMPQSDVDYIEATEPGFLQTTLDDWTEEIEARLRKRYSVPFSRTSPPRTALRWLTKLATRDAYHKRGYNPSSASDREAVESSADKAMEELTEAANAKDGLFDLPTPTDASGVTQGNPLAYTESSPYTWTSVQCADGRAEDGQYGR
jgi:hypothetical protein